MSANNLPAEGHQRKRLCELKNSDKPKRVRLNLDDPEFEDEEPEAEVEEETANSLPAEDLRTKRSAANQLREELKKKAKEAKTEAKEEWQRHLLSSSATNRMAPPVLTDEAIGEYNAKALSDVHTTHEVWAVRKVVFCTRCGYYKELK